MKYWMMRLFLTSRHMGLFSTLPPSESRKQYLSRIFGADINFQHRKKPYVYKAFNVGATEYLMGVVGKEHTISVGSSPTESFARKAVPDWQTSNVFVDPSGESDGQKVAMQDVRVVGQPLNVFRSLADHINHTNQTADWNISVNAITSEQEFWSAVARYKGRIAELDLNYVAPNIWGGTSETENALKKLHTENNAQEVEVRLKNPDKLLNPDSDTIRQSVEYITKGGGSLALKGDDRRSTLFSSEASVVTDTPSNDAQVEEEDVETLRAIAQELLKKHDPTAQRLKEPDK